MDSMHREVRRFSETEDGFILSHMRTMSATEIAAALGRRPASVVSRQVSLGVRKPNRIVRRFSKEDDAVIVGAAGRVSMYDVADQLGRKPSSVYGRAKTLGVDFSPARRVAQRRLRGGYWWVPLEVEGKRVWKAEHRHVMEAHIGRRLVRGEIVHHIDLDRGNNDVSNLFLCPSVSFHRSLHNALEKLLGSETVVTHLMRHGVVTFDHASGRYGIS